MKGNSEYETLTWVSDIKSQHLLESRTLPLAIWRMDLSVAALVHLPAPFQTVYPHNGTYGS